MDALQWPTRNDHSRWWPCHSGSRATDRSCRTTSCCTLLFWWWAFGILDIVGYHWTIFWWWAIPAPSPCRTSCLMPADKQIVGNIQGMFSWMIVFQNSQHISQQQKLVRLSDLYYNTHQVHCAHCTIEWSSKRVSRCIMYILLLTTPRESIAKSRWKRG